MAKLTTFEPQTTTSDHDAIARFLTQRGVLFTRWETTTTLGDGATPDEVLAAYDHELGPYMKRHGYATADVVCIDAATPNLPAIRDKFIREHTHSEDEVRFFVAGQGDFWFHLDGEVFCVRCEAGELISVPANTTHWFDAGASPFVKCIRVFTDASGWVPHYTDSGIERRYVA